FIRQNGQRRSALGTTPALPARLGLVEVQYLSYQLSQGWRSTTITMKEPGTIGGRRLGLAGVVSVGAGPNLAETTNTRCVKGSSPMFRPPCAVCTFPTT